MKVVSCERALKMRGGLNACNSQKTKQGKTPGTFGKLVLLAMSLGVFF